jgi:hypothetical protein
MERINTIRVIPHSTIKGKKPDQVELGELEFRKISEKSKIYDIRTEISKETGIHSSQISLWKNGEPLDYKWGERFIDVEPFGIESVCIFQYRYEFYIQPKCGSSSSVNLKVNSYHNGQEIKQMILDK